MSSIIPITSTRKQFVTPLYSNQESGVTPENLFDTDEPHVHSLNVSSVVVSEQIELQTELEISSNSKKTITENFAESENSIHDELDHLEEIFGPTIHMADHYHTLCEGRDYLLTVVDQPPHLRTIPKEIKKLFDCIRLTTHLIHRPEPEPLKQYFRGSTSYWAPVQRNSILLGYIKIFLEDPDFDTNDEYHCEHFKCVVDAYLILKPYRDQLISLNCDPNAKLIKVDDKADVITEFTSALLLNQFAKQLDENCNSYQFREAQRNRDRQVSSQFLSSTNYINRLRQNNGRLLVIRIDIHLPTNKKDMAPKKLSKHFFDFLHILRRKQGLHLTGYVWKLEYGAQQSFHYHCLFFLDGRKHAQDIKLAQFIGEIWDKVIGGKSCYFNCHHHKYRNRFRHPVMGRLEPYDNERYQRLLSVIRYFCKKDQFIVHRNCKGKRTLGMGQIKKSKKTYASV
jgi:hypothetical protein